jgi:hypothetical protein
MDVLAAILGRLVWGTVARQGLCLGGVDDDELTRFSKTALRKTSVVAFSAGALAVVASGFVAGESYIHVAGLIWWSYYLPAAALALFAGTIRFYYLVMRKAALSDREAEPRICSGTAQSLIVVKAGGWPFLMTGPKATWMSGSDKTLGDVRRRLGSPLDRRPEPRASRRRLRITLTVTYYPRCRVVREVTGMAVENLWVAWSARPDMVPGTATE